MRMRDLESLRRHLDEPPPTAETREAARAALRTRYASGNRSWRIGVPFALTAAVVAAVVVLSMRTGPAAAWSPIPATPPEPSLQAAAADACSGLAGSPLSGPLLIDQRGDVAVALFGERADEGDFHLTCTLVERGDMWVRAAADDLSFSLLVMSGSVDEDAVGSPVDRVVIDAEGEEVVVSYADGFYLIWWPEEVALTGRPMSFLSADGSTLLEIPVHSSRRGFEP